VKPPTIIETPGAARIAIGEEGSAYNEANGAKSLILRNWRPGDTILLSRGLLSGREEAVKIKQLFQDERIPLWKRGDWPVLEFGGKVVWASRFGLARDLPPSFPSVVESEILDLTSIQ